MIILLSMFVLSITLLQLSIADNVKSITAVSGDSIMLDAKRTIIQYLMSPIVFCTFFIMITALVKGEAIIFFLGLISFLIASHKLVIKQRISHNVFYLMSLQTIVTMIISFASKQ